MSDKELLEEFREFIDFMYESVDIEDHQRFIAISDSMLKDGWFKWIYCYATEQAERVQELEDIIYQDKRQAVLEGLYEQNKRYREVIQESNVIFAEAIESIDEDEEVNGLEYGIKITSEALEELG